MIDFIDMVPKTCRIVEFRNWSTYIQISFENKVRYFRDLKTTI